MPFAGLSMVGSTSGRIMPFHARRMATWQGGPNPSSARGLPCAAKLWGWRGTSSLNSGSRTPVPGVMALDRWRLLSFRRPLGANMPPTLMQLGGARAVCPGY